jgi:ribosomal protein S27E
MTDEAYLPTSIDGPLWWRLIAFGLTTGIVVFGIANALSKLKGKEAPTQEVASVKSAIPGEKFTKLRCFHCQHVQPVPVSVTSFECEECGQKLQRKTAS